MKRMSFRCRLRPPAQNCRVTCKHSLSGAAGKEAHQCSYISGQRSLVENVGGNSTSTHSILAQRLSYRECSAVLQNVVVAYHAATKNCVSPEDGTVHDCVCHGIRSALLRRASGLEGWTAHVMKQVHRILMIASFVHMVHPVLLSVVRRKQSLLWCVPLWRGCVSGSVHVILQPVRDNRSKVHDRLLIRVGAE